MVRTLRLAVLLGFVLALVPASAGAQDLDVSFEVVEETPVSVKIRATISGATGPIDAAIRIDPYRQNPTPSVNAVRVQAVERVASYRHTPEYETVRVPIADKLAALEAEVDALALQKPRGDVEIAAKKEAIDGKETERAEVIAQADHGATHYETQEVVAHRYALETKERLVPVAVASPGDKILLAPQSWAEPPPQLLIADTEIQTDPVLVNWSEDVRVYEWTIETGETRTPGGGWGSSGMLVLTINGRDYYDDTNSSWWANEWPYKMKLTIDNSASAEDLIDFPIMVKLTDARFDYSHAQLDGDDIRFVDADETKALNYELDTWERYGDSFFWVQVPQIDAGSTTDHIWMYFGSPDVGNGENAEVVWENGYEAVYHMNDATATTIADSTANHNTGTKGAGAAAPTEVAGTVGKAQQFVDGTYITLPDLSMTTDNPATLLVMHKWDAWAGLRKGLAIQNNRFGWYYYGNEARFGVRTPVGGADETVFAQGTYTDWHVKHGVYEPPTGAALVSAYEDGVFKSSAATNADAATTLAPSFVIGGQYLLGGTIDGWFRGLIDELRLSSVARSAEWIEAENLSMTDAMLTYGDSEDRPDADPVIPVPAIETAEALLCVAVAMAAVKQKHIILYAAAFILLLFTGFSIAEVSVTLSVMVFVFAVYMLYMTSLSIGRR